MSPPRKLEVALLPPCPGLVGSAAGDAEDMSDGELTRLEVLRDLDEGVGAPAVG